MFVLKIIQKKIYANVWIKQVLNLVHNVNNVITIIVINQMIILIDIMILKNNLKIIIHIIKSNQLLKIIMIINIIANNNHLKNLKNKIIIIIKIQCQIMIIIIQIITIIDKYKIYLTIMIIYIIGNINIIIRTYLIK